MSYAEFMGTDAYVAKYSGSAVGIVLVDNARPTEQMIGAASGINVSDEIEILPVEEAGERGTNEITQGRIASSGTINFFWTPEREDKLPTRKSFIGKEYTLFEVVGEGRPGAGTILRVFEGVKIGRVSSSHGARGHKTGDISFQYIQRYSGAEWEGLA